MKIKEIKDKAENLCVEVKTAGAMKQEGNIWSQKIIVRDNTGEMGIIYKNDRYLPLVRGYPLVIHKTVKKDGYYQIETKDFQIFSVSAEPPKGSAYSYQSDDEIDWDFINRGKVRHGLVCSYVEATESLKLSDEQKKDVLDLVEFVMTGII